MPHTKLDAGIVHSTVWREPHATRIVWITMLAMKNEHGEVFASVPGLADIARVTEEECDAALARFLAPDKRSRTQEHEGRRIQVIRGGWFILNHEQYRLLDTAEDRKHKDAVRQQRRRDRLKARAGGDLGPDLDTHDPSADPPRHATSRDSSRHTDSDSDSEAVTAGVKYGGFEDFWAEYPRRAGGNSKADALKCWKARLREGVEPTAILDGLKRYYAYCVSQGIVGTQWVKQAKTFLGPGEHWAEDWEPAPVPKGSTKTGRGKANMIALLEERGELNGLGEGGSDDARPIRATLPSG